MLFVTTTLGTPIYIATAQLVALRVDADLQAATLGIQYDDGQREITRIKVGEICTSKLMAEKVGEHVIKLDDLPSARKLNIGLAFPADVAINRWQIHWGLADNRKRSA